MLEEIERGDAATSEQFLPFVYGNVEQTSTKLGHFQDATDTKAPFIFICMRVFLPTELSSELSRGNWPHNEVQDEKCNDEQSA